MLLLSYKIILALVMSTSFVSSSALPSRTENNVQSGTIFSSAQFKDTDSICVSLYQNWIRDQGSLGQRMTRFGYVMPLVVSWYVVIETSILIKFECKDFRTVNTIDRAIRDRGEVDTFGPLYLQCDASKEVARQETRPATSVWQYKRKIGVCAPLSNAKEIAPSANIASGSTSCVQGEADGDQFASLRAFMESDHDNAGDFTKEQYDQFAEWLTIEELETSREEHSKGSNIVSLDLEHSRKGTYRACAKQRAGHGNARLHLVGFAT